MNKSKVEVQAELDVLVGEMTTKREAVETALAGLDKVISDGQQAITEIKEAIVAKEQAMQETADHTALTALIEEKNALENRLATQALANGQLQKNYQVSTVEPLLVELIETHKPTEEKLKEFDRACVSEMAYLEAEQFAKEVKAYENQVNIVRTFISEILTEFGFIKKGENRYKGFFLNQVYINLKAVNFAHDLMKLYKYNIG